MTKKIILGEKKKQLVDLVEKNLYDVYIKNGITYLPHYVMVGFYVGPGFGQNNVTLYSAATLENAGAKKSSAYLMLRALWNK